MKHEELKEILDSHSRWLRDTGGNRADLSDADLREELLINADLRGADLRGADLREANLWGADLRGANLSDADLRNADLRDADLRGADLREADLRGADLWRAYLHRADLTAANLNGADLRKATLRNADLTGVRLFDTTGNDKEIRTIYTSLYIINISGGIMQIGCERHKIAEWMAFDDEHIAAMDHDALEWWKEWKPKLKSILDINQ